MTARHQLDLFVITQALQCNVCPAMFRPAADLIYAGAASQITLDVLPQEEWFRGTPTARIQKEPTAEEFGQMAIEAKWLQLPSPNEGHGTRPLAPIWVCPRCQTIMRQIKGILQAATPDPEESK